MLALWAWSDLSAASDANLIRNGGFAEGLTGWNPFWTRTAGAGQLALDHQIYRSGNASARLEHRDEADWSFSAGERLPVEPGALFELECWLKSEGAGEVSLCVINYDEASKPLDWAYGQRTLRGSSGWRHLHSRFVVPDGVAYIHPRLMGHGFLTVWVDDASLRSAGSISQLRHGDLPEETSIRNATLVVTLRTAGSTLSVRDRRTGRTWSQQAMHPDLLVTQVRGGSAIELSLLQLSSGQEIETSLELDGDLPEFTCTLSATGPLDRPLQFPHPFVTEPGTSLVLPMNEGISYPVEDDAIQPMRLIAYGGHGISMAFWGVTDGERSQMAIIETPDDAAIRVDRHAGLLCLKPEWDPQKGRFGYPRRLRYIFLDQGGHVAMGKRYRAYARKTGGFKTLLQKRAENPDVDLLIGAVNVWCWDQDALSLVREMKSLGMDRILWSHRQSPESLRALNGLDVLTSRYDIYQDVMDPAQFRFLRGIHPDWTTAAWPKDIIRDAGNDWLRGWRIKGTNGQWYPCGVICDRQALPYAADRISAELKTHPYRCRFIDTTTAAPWHECYDAGHPMTRSDSRRWKMELLRYVSEEMKLVTGSETGHDAAVPFLHYFEGMLSLGPYRVPDAGRNMQRILEEVPDRVATFQLGQQYRLPLWELVYHDCVVAHWYWGDYNNKLPALWRKRDLFNILYGTPPMFMFNRTLWNQNKERFRQSYRRVAPVARATGYAEMTDHRFLTPDRAVQETTFDNGIRVIVNFGDTPYRMPGGKEIPGQDFSCEGLPP